MKIVAEKSIPGYEGYYSVNTNGEIFSCRVSSSKRMEGKVLRKKIVPVLNNKGYCRVGLHVNKKIEVFSVHRIVGMVFMPCDNPKFEINHKNGNKADNRLENLEWVSRSDNARHAYNTRLRLAEKQGKKGEDNVGSKLKNSDVIKIRKLFAQGGKTYIDIARIFNVSGRLVSLIVRGKIWKHI